MATLTGRLVAETYKALLKLIDNDVITGSEKQISDGLGGSTGVFIDTNGFLRASKFIVTGGNSGQFLKGDGSLDGNTYLSLAAANALYLPIGSTTSAIAEGSRLYFTQSRVLSTVLTGFVSTSGTVTASDSVLSAIEKLWWNIVNGGGGGGGGYIPYVGALQNVNLGEWGISAGYFGFDLTPTGTPTTAGTMSWNSQDGTADIKMGGGNVTLQVGQEELVRVVNKTGANLLEANYQAVRVSGAQGNRLKVSLAKADNDANSADTIGLVTETINNNNEGFVTAVGLVRDIDTTGDLQGETWADGEMVYLSADTAGMITNIKPQAPQHGVRMGYVVRAHKTQGQIYVKVDNGYELDELHNVLITDPVTQDILTYDETLTGGLWINRNIWTAIGATEVGKGFLSIPDADTLIPVPTKPRIARINLDNTVDAIEVGTQGYLPFYDATDFYPDSPVFTDGTDVVIGGETPNGTNKLTVIGGIWGEELVLNDQFLLATNPIGGNYSFNIYDGTSWVTQMVLSQTNLVFNISGFEKMRLNSSGYLGIGTDTPTALIHAKGTTAYPKIKLDNASTSGGGMFSAYQNGTEIANFGVSGAWLLDSSSDVAIVATKAGQGIQFYTNGSNSEKMGINSDGNLFVGQTPTFVAGATQAIVRGKTGAGFLGVQHYDMSIKGSINTFNSVFQVGTSTFHSVAVIVEDVERARFNSGGRFLLGTTTDNTVDIFQANGSIIATAIKKTGGTSAQYLMADGSVSTLASYVPTSRTLTINGTAFDLSADRSWTIAGTIGGLTTNYVPKATSANTLGNSLIYDNGTSVIIGGTSSSANNKLSVEGNSNLAGDTNIGGFITGVFSKTLPTGNTFAGQTININGSANGWGLISRNTWNFTDDAFTTGGVTMYDNRAIITRSTTASIGYTNYQSYIINNGTASQSATGIWSFAAGTGNFGSFVGYHVGANGPINNTNSYTSYYGFDMGNTPQNNVTNYYGVNINDFTGTTLSRGIQLSLSAGTGKWNIYAGGTANNYLAGSLGIGSTSLTGVNLNVAKNITGNVISYGIYQSGVSQTDVTTTAYGFVNISATAASAYTLLQYFHYSANQGTIGAGSAITTQIGFEVASTLIGATNNFGFRGRIPSGTNRWNLYMDGTANNYMAGSLGIGSTNIGGGNGNLNVAKTITGNTFSTGIWQNGVVQNDVTGGATGIQNDLKTLAATFNLGSYYHYLASQVSIGAGSTITNQYGYTANSNLIGATNNYGFYGNIPSGTGRWNLFMNGTANNFMAGSLGIGATTLTGYSLRISKTLTGGTNTVAVNADGVVQSDSTSSSAYFSTFASTQAATYTIGNLVHFNASQSTIGSGSTVTNQYGFTANSTLIGATNNFGFYGNLAAGTGRWNIYMNGTANNYLAGNLLVGTTTEAGFKLDVVGTARLSGLGTFSSSIVVGDGTQTPSYAGAITIRTGVAFAGLDFKSARTSGNIGGVRFYDSTDVIKSVIVSEVDGSLVFSNLNPLIERVRINAIGSLGIASSALAGITLRISKIITGAVYGYGVLQDGRVQSDVTTGAYGFLNQLSTQTASFTLPFYIHYLSNQQTIGVGSTITSQYGFYADATLTGATNNYGFFGNIAAGNNRWNLYMSGTANNFMAGSLGIGSTSLTGVNLFLTKTITGSTDSSAVINQGTVQSDVTSNANGFYNILNTAASSFTLNNYIHFRTVQGTIGAGSVINTQTGFLASATLTGATNNYGFAGNIPSGTGRWNLYMAGTASNYINGTLLIGTLTDGGYKVNISGTLNATALRITGGASTQYLMADGTTSTITDSFVTSKILTGLTISGTTVTSSDSILIAIGKIQNQLNGLSGSLSYRGTWNASTNTPTITSGVGTNGYFYIVSTAGTTTIDGISSWEVGDWIIFNGTTWQKIATQAVTSVNGFTGAVVLTTSNISEGSNLYYTNARGISSTLNGYTSGSGTITSSDTILSAIQKLNGNIGNLITGVSSVFGRTGAISAQSGDYTTTLVTEGTNLYFTNARALSAIFTGTSAQFLKANGTTNEIVTDLDANIVGDKDGVNRIYTLTNNYLTGSTRVFVNGIRMQLGATNDYIEINSNQIQFSVSLDSGDILVVDYIK